MSDRNVSHLPDDLLTGEEYGRRHYEALRNPKHPHHEWVSIGFAEQCAIDATNQGLDANAAVGGSGVVEVNYYAIGRR